MNRKSDDERYSETQHIRMTTLQREALLLAAERAGMDAGPYARRLIVSLLGEEMMEIMRDRIADDAENSSSKKRARA